MKDIAAQLEGLGIERRFALDIASVIAGVRPRGLLHVTSEQQHGLELLLNSSGLRVEAFRDLYRRHDARSREGVLNENPLDDPASEKWCEIWYANPNAARVDQVALFGNPGKFLGYPDCCRRVMNSDDALARLYRRYFFEDSLRHWELNRLAALFHDSILMPDFFPCSMSCGSAKKYVTAFHDVAAQVFSKSELQKTVAAMRAPITILAGDVVQWADWTFDRERLCVKAVSGRKESLNKISSYLPTGSSSTALLVAFQHFLRGEVANSLTILAISAEEGQTIEVPLALI